MSGAFTERMKIKSRLYAAAGLNATHGTMTLHGEPLIEHELALPFWNQMADEVLRILREQSPAQVVTVAEVERLREALRQSEEQQRRALDPHSWPDVCLKLVSRAASDLGLDENGVVVAERDLPKLLDRAKESDKHLRRARKAEESLAALKPAHRVTKDAVP